MEEDLSSRLRAAVSSTVPVYRTQAPPTANGAPPEAEARARQARRLYDDVGVGRRRRARRRRRRRLVVAVGRFPVAATRGARSRSADRSARPRRRVAADARRRARTRPPRPRTRAAPLARPEAEALRRARRAQHRHAKEGPAARHVVRRLVHDVAADRQVLRPRPCGRPPRRPRSRTRPSRSLETRSAVAAA